MLVLVFIFWFSLVKSPKFDNDKISLYLVFIKYHLVSPALLWSNKFFLVFVFVEYLLGTPIWTGLCANDKISISSGQSANDNIYLSLYFCFSSPKGSNLIWAGLLSYDNTFLCLSLSSLCGHHNLTKNMTNHPQI